MSIGEFMDGENCFVIFSVFERLEGLGLNVCKEQTTEEKYMT